MSNYSSLKATINANVKTNGNQEITGAVLNSVLNAMVDSEGAGYQFMGVATPTSPGSSQTPDYKCFYLAATPGTYTYLGGLVVADGEVAILKYDSSWHKEVTGAATASEVSQLGQEVSENTENIVNLQQEIDNIQPIVIEGDVTNAPDEEDITTDENNLLKFANRPTALGQMGYKILRKDKTFAAQVTDANTIYEIRYPFDLNGDEVTIPAGCVLKFVGGQLSNGVLVGDGTKVVLNNNIFDQVELQGTFYSDKDVVSTHIFKTWSPYNFLGCVLLCNEGGEIILDKEFIYTSSKRIVISKSINVNGCGHTLTTINSSNNRTLGLFDISDCDSFSLRNLTIDGGISVTYDSNNWPVVSNFGPAENTYFIITKGVKKVEFDSCQFVNIYAPNLVNYKDPELYTPAFIVVIDYESASVTNCNISHENNVFTSEGFKFMPKTNLSYSSFGEYDEHQALFSYFYGTAEEYGIEITEADIKEGINNNDFPNSLLLEGNTIDFTNTSSAVEVLFGTAKIANNIFGTTTGSVLNTFVTKSDIINNTFDNVHRSGAIDLDEQGEFGFIPKNIRIADNTFGFCREGFVMFYRGENITIENNVVDGESFNTERLDYFDSRWQSYERVMAWACYLSSGKNISLNNNQLRGYTTLFPGQYYSYEGSSNELILELTLSNNTLEQLASAEVCHIRFRRSGKLNVINNVIINAGKEYHYKGYYRTFISTDGLKYYAGTDFFISGNRFIEERTDFDAIAYCSSINTSSGVGIAGIIKINSFHFCDNCCQQKTHISLLAQNPNVTPTKMDSSNYVVKRNNLCGGSVFGVVNIDTDIEDIFQTSVIGTGSTLAMENPLAQSSWVLYNSGIILRRNWTYRMNTNTSSRKSYFFFMADYNGVAILGESLSSRNTNIKEHQFSRKGENLYFCLVGGTTAASSDGIDYDSDDLITDGSVVLMKVGNQPSNIAVFGGFTHNTNQIETTTSSTNYLLDDGPYLAGDFNYSVVHVYGKVDLGGASVNLNANSVLIIYPTGNISYGTIIGNNTLFVTPKSISCSISGTFRHVAYSGLPQSLIGVFTGQQVYDKQNNRLAVWSGTAWVSADGKTDGVHSGSTTTRSGLTLNSVADIGYTYFDTDLGKMVVWNGSAWVNMDGTALA